MFWKITLTLAYRLHRAWCFVVRPLSVSVKLMLIREGQVALVQHTYQRGWFLPGGGVKRGETLEHAARREAREELGAVLRDVRLWGVYTNFAEFKSDHLAVFVCEDFTLAASDATAPAGFGPAHAEIERLQFFPLTALPADLEAGNARRVQEYHAGHAPGVAGW